MPSPSQVDGWLQQMGDSDTYDAAKGVNWGVMPGPFYTPDCGWAAPPAPRRTAHQRRKATVGNGSGSKAVLTGHKEAIALGKAKLGGNVEMAGYFILSAQQHVPR